MALKRYPELAQARSPALTDLRPSEWRWLRVSEAAEALGVSESTVRRRIHRGRLVARREPYGRSFRWLVRFPCEVDEPRPNLRLVPPIETPRTPEGSETPEAPETPELPETPASPVPGEEPSASTRLIASLSVDRPTPADAEVAADAIRPERAYPAHTERASRVAFWVAVVVAAVAIGVLALEPPAWSRGVALAVAALAVLMAFGEGAAGLWQRGSGEPERE